MAFLCGSFEPWFYIHPISPAVRVLVFLYPARAARAKTNPCQARRIVGDRRNHDRSNGRSQPIRYTSNNTAGPKTLNGRVKSQSCTGTTKCHGMPWRCTGVTSSTAPATIRQQSSRIRSMQHDQCNLTRFEPTVANELRRRCDSRPGIGARTASSDQTAAHLTRLGCQRPSCFAGRHPNLTRGASAYTLWFTKQPRPLLPNGPRFPWPGVVPRSRDSTPWSSNTCQVGRASYPDYETPRTAIPEASDGSLRTHIAPPCGLTAQVPNGLLLPYSESELSCSRCTNRSVDTQDTCSTSAKTGDAFGTRPTNLTKAPKVCFLDIQGPLLARASEAACNVRAQLDGPAGHANFLRTTALPERPCNPIAIPSQLDESYRACTGKKPDSAHQAKT